MEYIDFKKLVDALTSKPKETEWLNSSTIFILRKRLVKESPPCQIVPIYAVCLLVI